MRLVCQEVISTYVFTVAVFLVFIVGVPLSVGIPIARLVNQTHQLNIGFSLAAILAGVLLLSKTTK